MKKKMNKANLKKLERFAETALPKVMDKLIIDTDDGWVLFAKYTISKTTDGYYTVKNVGDTMKPIRFNKLRNAVSWAILWDKTRIYEATRVHTLDIAIGSMEIEKFLHKRMKSNKDTEIYLIQDAKLSESIAKQKQFTYELDKYIIMANISQIRGFENELKRITRDQ